jgi:alpha-glutamyl/putrescinyl thymine pyrophosphorylase clade 1
MSNDLNVFSKMLRPKPSPVYDTYWRFAAERQKVFFNRLSGALPPWSSDPILRVFKFTNAYRAADRVSQFLIKDVIYRGSQSPEELFFRILLFKLFNKVDTWKHLVENLGEITCSSFTYDRYNSILTKLKQRGETIYSGAYIMASGRSAFGKPLKHQNHLQLLDKMLNDNLPSKLIELKSLGSVYSQLLKYPSIGSFLAYQYAIDINYSTLTNFSEMDFVKAGPGAKDGIKKCFTDPGDFSEEDIIKYVTENQNNEFSRLGLEFKTLWGRRLQLIDCQNLFCEVDKYSRVAHPEIKGASNRNRIKQKFRPTDLKVIEYFFPPKWQLSTAFLKVSK